MKLEFFEKCFLQALCLLLAYGLALTMSPMANTGIPTHQNGETLILEHKHFVMSQVYEWDC